jgi:hypothetical protein
MKKAIHVVPYMRGWATKREGASKAGKVTATQQRRSRLLGQRLGGRDRSWSFMVATDRSAKRTATAATPILRRVSERLE